MKKLKSGKGVKELPSDKQPEFVLFMGGVAAGKPRNFELMS
jgi:hypothetical protein